MEQHLEAGIYCFPLVVALSRCRAASSPIERKTSYSYSCTYIRSHRSIYTYAHRRVCMKQKNSASAPQETRKKSSRLPKVGEGGRPASRQARTVYTSATHRWFTRRCVVRKHFHRQSCDSCPRCEIFRKRPSEEYSAPPEIHECFVSARGIYTVPSVRFLSALKTENSASMTSGQGRSLHSRRIRSSVINTGIRYYYNSTGKTPTRHQTRRLLKSECICAVRA